MSLSPAVFEALMMLASWHADGLLPSLTTLVKRMLALDKERLAREKVARAAKKQSVLAAGRAGATAIDLDVA
jgi:hypothetical protein